MSADSKARMRQYEHWVESIWNDTASDPGHILNICDRIIASQQGDIDRGIQVLARQHEELRALFISAVGLNEEAGEVAGPLKKFVRNPIKNPLDREHLIDECGDVLYYLVKILHYVDATLDDAMQANEEKINVRYGNNRSAEGES